MGGDPPQTFQQEEKITVNCSAAAEASALPALAIGIS
jgi:hypothetical protein